MTERQNNKLGAVTAVFGALILFIGTLWHPMDADPNDPQAAFAEYATDNAWVASHLLQLFGIILIVVALVLLTRRIFTGGGAVWALVGSAIAVASLAVAGALQAVDGIALKVMVDRWAAASGPEKESLFLATFAVRQIEIGLASIFSLLMGLSVTSYGRALISDHSFPNWLGGLAILGGLPLVVAGIVMAYTGFSGTAMNINMVSSTLLLGWLVIMGFRLWHLTPGIPPDAMEAD